MTRKNERQISKKTVSFRINKGDKQAPEDKYPSTIEYHDIMNRYNITSKKEKPVDAIKLDDESDYSDYYDSKASSSPKVGHIPLKHPPPPPPKQSNLSGLEETIDSLDDSNERYYQR